MTHGAPLTTADEGALRRVAAHNWARILEYVEGKIRELLGVRIVQSVNADGTITVVTGNPARPEPWTVPAATGLLCEPGDQVLVAHVDGQARVVLVLSTTLTAGGGGTALPDQAGNAGEFLMTDGSTLSWAVPGAGGTTISVQELGVPIGSTSILDFEDTIFDVFVSTGGRIGIGIDPVPMAEYARDAIGAALVNGGGITITVSDAGNTITLTNQGYLPGGTDVAVADGGTGASDAATARTNLGAAAAGHSHAAADVTSGVLATGRLGSGTPSANAWLRGDGAWAADPGSTAILVPPGLTAVNVTNVTGLTTGICGAVYLGKAPFAITSMEVLCEVATAAATIIWAEVGIATGALTASRGNSSLTQRGSASVAATYNAVGEKATTISVSGVNAGDDLWLTFGSSATTPFQLRAGQPDRIRSGMFKSATARPSTLSATAFVTVANNVNVPWVAARVAG